jgi:hypothetical protein
MGVVVVVGVVVIVGVVVVVWVVVVVVVPFTKHVWYSLRFHIQSQSFESSPCLYFISRNVFAGR